MQTMFKEWQPLYKEKQEADMIIKQITKQEIKKLVDTKPGVCVSIYIPGYKGGADFRQHPTRLKNLISEAVDRLNANGLSVSEAKKMLEPAENLLRSELFAQEQSDSFVAFVSMELSEYYRLNFSVEEEAVVSS